MGAAVGGRSGADGATNLRSGRGRTVLRGRRVGLAALALEVVWFRMLVLFLDATTYAFTTMLATVLAGIAVGGGMASWLLRRDRDWTVCLCALQLATGVAVMASAAFLSWSYAAGWRTSAPVAASAAAIFPAAVLMGLSFPIALRASIRVAEVSDAAATARRVGRLYALNVGGAVAGAALGSNRGRDRGGQQAQTQDVQRCENVPDYWDVTYVR